MDTLRYCKLVANEVTKALQKADISTLSASEQTGIPRTTLIRRLENPESSPLTTRELALLAKLTGTTASTFLMAADKELTK